MSIEGTTAAWRKSSYSGTQADNCVEVAPLTSTVGVRDSKLDASPIIKASAEAWGTLLDGIRRH